MDYSVKQNTERNNCSVKQKHPLRQVFQQNIHPSSEPQYKAETNDNLDGYHKKWRLIATIFYTDGIMDENQRRAISGLFDIVDKK
jgi:hypothetical protein